MKCSLTPHCRALNVTCLAHLLEGHHILKCDCALFHLGGSSLAMTWGDTGVWMGDRGTVIQGGGNPVSPVQSCKRVYCIIGLGIHVYTYEKSHIHILATKYDKSYRGWRQPSVTCPTCPMCVIYASCKRTLHVCKHILTYMTIVNIHITRSQLYRATCVIRASVCRDMFVHNIYHNCTV